jgi:putative oxidoreductase
MKNLSIIGRFLFALPLIGFGLGHLTNPEGMAGMVPAYFPGGVFWVYLTGVAFIAAAISFMTGQMMRIAGMLLAMMLGIFVLTIHLPAVQGVGMKSLAFAVLLKDLALAGGALVIASQDR